MLNQYYEFLTNTLITWLSNQNSLNSGSKYFVLLDNAEDTSNFYQTIRNYDFEGKINFKSSEFDFETVGYQSNGVKILFVAPINNVTADFLVTVRNRVNANQGEWKNTAVFFMVHNALDSIVGGAYDVSQKDAPFNSKKIEDAVLKEISKAELSRGHKLILESYLKEVTNQPMTVLKDFETLFNILEAKHVSDDDFNTMGYFPDNQINTYDDDRTIKDRIQQNKKLFENVETIHQFSDVRDRLSEAFQGNEVIRDLAKEDDWKLVEFNRVNKAKNDFDQNNIRDIEIDTDKIKESDDKIWFRLHGTTKAQRRKAHFVISNTGKNNEIKLEIPFDDRLRQSDINRNLSYVNRSFGVTHDDYEILTQNKKLVIHLKNLMPSQTYGGKIQYTHYGKGNLKFIISFMVLPFSLNIIKKLRPNFQINILGSRKNRKYYFGVADSNSRYQFGDGEKEIQISNNNELQNEDISDSTIILSDSFSGEVIEDLRFEAKIGEYFFPFELMDVIYKPIPSPAITVERMRLGIKDSQFIYQDHKIYTGSRNISVEKLYQEYLDLELIIIESQSLSGEMLGQNYQAIELRLPKSVNDAYKKLFDYYKKEETTLSLAVPNEIHLELLQNVLSSIRDELDQSLVNQKSIDTSIRDIARIGVVMDGDVIRVNPLNPLQIAYQLELNEALGNSQEVPRDAILSTLNAENLLPYVKVNNQHYQATYTRNYPRWMFYNKISDRQLSDLSSNIITQRIDDYLNQYQFMFSTNSEMVLNIAAIDILDEKNFFDAIINFMVGRLKDVKDIKDINPINLYVNKIGYSINSLFRQLYNLSNMEELNNLLKNTILKRHYKDYEDYEVIEMLQHKISIYKLPEKDSEQREDLFFHITFYQFSQKDKINDYNMNNLSKNYSLNGLLNNSQFYLENNQYINGFGLGRSTDVSDESELIQFTSMWNSFIAKTNNVTDIYQEDFTLVNYVPKINQAELKPMFDSSGWVTLLNLDVDLSYFYDDDNLDLIVIHYSDQNASNQYESVTVTNDVTQYEYLLNIHLGEYSAVNEINTEEIIKNFNAINGQWLLKLISNKQKQRGNRHVFREKLSIISAYKELLGILKHPDIYWVPISMEEILRVSGMVGLSKSQGLFSAANLGHSGATNDDLLMMGMDVSGSKIKLHFLPVEVKIGINDTSIRKKAIKQVENTYSILQSFLSEINEDSFMRKYYLNFFISLMISNLKKMIISDIYIVDEIPNLEEIIDQLNIGNFELSNEMLSYYGKGFIFEFTTEQNARIIQRLIEDDISLIKVPESDAYNVVSHNTRELINGISQGKFDFAPETLLINKKESSNDNQFDNRNKDSISISSKANVVKLDMHIEDELIYPTENRDTPTFVAEQQDEKNVIDEDSDFDFVRHEEELDNVLEKKRSDWPIDTPKVKLSDKRLLIGKVLGSNYEVFWEYGHKQLSNRHMLVTGKSGQGKTYFIQTLLYEFSKNDLNVLVVDYTDGFLPTQLDDALQRNLGEKLKHKIIYQELMPLNPFKIQKIDLGGFEIDETVLDMVERVVQIIDYVFDLGIQQRTLLTETIKAGYEQNQSFYTFSYLREDLKNSDDSAKRNLYGRISTLLDRDPFAYNNDFSWSDIYNNNGEVHIFQLKGYQRQIQQVMIEFMLWDLVQYATIAGNESKPLPIVLDEIQNLNFNANSPAVKILREGRKFGLSGIFATQSLDSVRGSDSEAIYNAAQQVHFLPPDSQVKNITKMMSSSGSSSQDVENQLKNLHKGEAVINGPILNDQGNLTPPQRYGVSISSFDERL
ncbi:helicase HerA domain-containing protein [Fundicoccus sp. Sow4_H7]|uniref:helicase HerA domain-containing protein n=1 Tax=Fundicoccus sp. Sow4_H7 TaxID=3438784 RepID=UPI003F932570